MKIKLSRLKVGDIFIYDDTIYEIIGKDAQTTYCKYPNEKYKKVLFAEPYLYCCFNNYLKVEL